MKHTLESLEQQGLVLFKAIAGSQAYGTNTPSSDTDIRYVYILPEEHILGTKYVEQVAEDKNDVIGYEIRRFLELLQISNPNVVEFLNIPDDCVLYKHPVFDRLLEKRDLFITKQLKNTLVGYAKQQIVKATGQDKKMNWDKQRVKRKTPLDFCYVTYLNGSKPLVEWLNNSGVLQENCGLTAIDHMRDMYYLYIGPYRTTSIENGVERLVEEGHYKGVIQSEKSNDISLSSIPKGFEPANVVFYHKDGYTQHCREFREYEEWVAKRNMARWVDTKNHGQMIDGKNMMHCYRLIQMGKEIASGEGFNVRRPDAEYLKSIRRGEVNLQTLVDQAAALVKEVDALFEASSLPEKVDPELIHNTLYTIRRDFYSQQ